VTAELTTRPEDPVSTKTVRRELHKPNVHDRAAIAKPLITENNAKRRKRWCDDHKIWMSDDQKYVIWSDESSFALFPTSGRTPMEACNPECQVRVVKHGGGSVVVWAAISWYSAGRLITLHGQITASDYMDILGNQVHPVVRMFTNSDAVFQDGSSPILTARSVQSGFDKHEDALQHLPWPAQSLDLNIIEPPWSVLERRVRSRLLPPSSVKQLDDDLHEERHSIALATVQNCVSLLQEGHRLWWPNSVLIKVCICHNCSHNLSISCVLLITDTFRSPL
jgi:hypothetical protein